MGLKDLPVRPTFTSNLVRETYVKELAAVETPEQLKTFILRWQPLYRLTPKEKKAEGEKDAKRYRQTKNSFKKILKNEVDLSQALDCIQKSRKSACGHASSYSCPGMHLAAPTVLLYAAHVSDHFGVSEDLALIQLGGGIAAFEAKNSHNDPL